MSEKQTNSKDAQLRLPKRTVSVSEEMSVDTRVAAQAIINDDAIGVHSDAAPTTHPSRFVEWVLKYRLWLTIGVVLLVTSIMLASVLFEVNERTHQSDLQTTLHELTADFVQAGGPEMVEWIDSNDVRAIETQFKEQKPDMLKILEGQGFSVKPEDLRLRRDGQSGLVIGASLQIGQDEKTLIWGTKEREENSSQQSSGDTSQVIVEQWDSLIFIGLMATLFIAFIWLAPVVLMRRDSNSVS